MVVDLFGLFAVVNIVHKYFAAGIVAWVVVDFVDKNVAVVGKIVVDRFVVVD